MLLAILALVSRSPQMQISSDAASLANHPGPRAGHSMVYDEERKMVLLMDGYEHDSFKTRSQQQNLLSVID